MVDERERRIWGAPYILQNSERKRRERIAARRFLERIYVRYQGTAAEEAVNICVRGAMDYLDFGGNPRKVIGQISKYKPKFNNCVGTKLPLNQRAPPFSIEGMMAIDKAIYVAKR